MVAAAKTNKTDFMTAAANFRLDLLILSIKCLDQLRSEIKTMIENELRGISRQYQLKH